MSAVRWAAIAKTSPSCQKTTPKTTPAVPFKRRCARTPSLTCQGGGSPWAGARHRRAGWSPRFRRERTRTTEKAAMPHTRGLTSRTAGRWPPPLSLRKAKRRWPGVPKIEAPLRVSSSCREIAGRRARGGQAERDPQGDAPHVGEPVLGVDYSPTAIRFAKELEDRQLRFRLGDFETVGRLRRTFDCVLTCRTLINLADTASRSGPSTR
jgi:hypothetical protein